MKILITMLIIMLAGLQYRLWFGDGSMQEVWRLRNQARDKNTEVLRLRSRNEALEAEVVDLKKGLDAIEERARTELGMISADETFYQFIKDPNTNNDPAAIPSVTTRSTANESSAGERVPGDASSPASTGPRSTAEAISGAADVSRQ